jgi:hypothetical protein
MPARPGFTPGPERRSSDSVEREKRLRRNQELFNRANQRLAELLEDRVVPEQLVPFLCECSDEACFATVTLTPVEFGELHEGGDRYVMLAGHLMAEAERVVDERGDVHVTEKE